MALNWNRKEDRKKMLDKAKQVLDSALSKGKALSTEAMYQLVEQKIGFEELKIINPSILDKVRYNDSIREAKRRIVSETMRWIKVQILRKNLILED